ncbi:MAG TPA: single-stranded-DNA-specific exonuclease RecJ, partial [Candidatus Saccharimonadales bacterium]|nr:single-stranded-DNA-specific exonuclease RecJ [Candidatus Saccharimonadales bacterium]
MKFNWRSAPPQPELCARRAQEAGISPLLAQCLLNRGFSAAEPIARFLEPRLKHLSDPFLLPNMEAAVQRLLVARAAGELLVIFGDYDVDGVTSTVLLLESLGRLGWKVAHYLPHRMDEGYGFSGEAVQNCLTQFPAKLLLAVDCGSTACETIASLAGNGIDVIVLDHHQPSTPPPAAIALVNPYLGADFHELCSAGLAFKLVHAVLKRMREQGVPEAAAVDLRASLDLVALGTIADLVPLQGENRIFVKAGLERLNATQRPGLLALKAVSKSAETVGCYEVGFQLAPRLNAAGRMENAEEALRLLMAPTAAEAEPIARSLDQRNRQRQEVERGICDEVMASLRPRFNHEKDYVIVEGDMQWHIGVVGIVAARVLREFYRPTLILGGDGDMWRGSGRSIEGFDLAGALRSCAELLVRHGGHAMAAGVTLRSEKVDLLRARLNELARQSLNPSQLQPSLHIDAEVSLLDLTVGRVEELARLEPAGQGNAPVRLAIRGLTHQQPPQRMGKENQHVKFRVTDGPQRGEAVWWNCGDAPLPKVR